MKKYLFILTGIFLVSISTISLSQEKIKENPYNLELVSTIEEYKQEVKKDSNNALVDLEEYIPGIVLDIRYATTNNFTGQKLYNIPKAYARKPVADSLLKIQYELNKKGLGLKIFDSYRPYAVTLKFYRIYKDINFVAAPWKGSLHNTGAAVDLTLVDIKSGKELQMPTGFDDFTVKASHEYMDLPADVIGNRKTLKDIMRKYGFYSYSKEWWHYSYKYSRNFSFLNLDFEELEE
ncbi:MAG TPA: D-alanyl-D-alanine dipeptidase [Bacteroidetes bacterium]|nr:D-alanyl-D-alanine dipeptidase [Bacteroidota bacterium]